MPRTSEYKLDELDRNLVKELEDNARQSIYALAKKLGTSPSTVHKRMKRLLKERVVVVAALPHPRAMGLTTVVVMGINVTPGKAEATAKHLELCSGFRHIGIYTGSYDICFVSFFPDARNLVDFIDKTLAGTPDITNIETIMAVEAVKNSYKLFGNDAGLIRHPIPRDLDQLDLKLIGELVVNPLISLTELHKRLGISRVSAGKKLQSLVDDHILKLVCIANPAAFGFKVTSLIFVKVQPGHAVRSVAINLASLANLQHITIITGRYNICCRAIFQDLAQMYDFLRNDLCRVLGILKYEIMLQTGASSDFFKKPVSAEKET